MTSVAPSVTYLTNFPFDKIKIDRTFGQGILNRRESVAIVSSVLALAQGLGTITTVAGIESQEQFEYMRRAGADLAQGFLFGRPVPVARLDLGGATSRPGKRSHSEKGGRQAPLVALLEFEYAGI